MKYRLLRPLPIMTVIAGCGLFCASAQAEMLCDGANQAIMSVLPPLPKGCQRERIEVSGGLSYNIFQSAEKKADAAWRREALTKYGERFQDIEAAACVRHMCVKGSLPGTQRCTTSALPCASDMEPADLKFVRELKDDPSAPLPVYAGTDYRELSRSEIMDLQRFLGVYPDGIFGERSMAALREWRRGAHLYESLGRESLQPTLVDLQRIRGTTR